MKINVLHIIYSHWKTMRNANSGKIIFTDIITFYIIPIIAGTLSYLFEIKFRADVYNLSITFFGIFIALLLNIQVAIFGIYQRKWSQLKDKREMEVQEKFIEIRRILLSELNTNISYLTVFSILSLLSFICFFIFQPDDKISTTISVSIYFHFILTFLMIAKRSHYLFQREYEDP